MHEKQFSPDGFQWIDYGDHENSVLTYIRKGLQTKDDLIIAINFTPVPRENYRLGVPKIKQLKVLFNSDATEFGGSGVGKKTVKPVAKPSHGHDMSVELTLPPLGILVYK